MQSHDVLYEHLEKRSLGFKVEKEFNSPGLFLGSVLTLNVSDMNRASLLPLN